ncbi:MAG: hypothetical protein P4M11_10595 [Candidatus Pacebacteria bacterium]|nr:hypothetical protein [Candidatus Paceibacterota bacterium]
MSAETPENNENEFVKPCTCGSCGKIADTRINDGYAPDCPSRTLVAGPLHSRVFSQEYREMTEGVLG